MSERLRSPRIWLIVAVVAGVAVVATIVATNDSSESQSSENTEKFCVTLSADYAAALGSIEGQSTGIAEDSAASTVRWIYADFVASAPARFRSQTRELVEGIERAIDGSLAPNERDSYLRKFEVLRGESVALCRNPR